VHVPELLEQSNTNHEYVELLRAASATATDTDTVVAAVEQSLGDPTQLSATRVAVARDLFYRAGTATQRATDELYAVMELDRPGVRASHMERTVAA
jgi:UDP-N-acetyl-D-mannosaminuronic acid transferase (WecB/TagA/CpsF family)